ncbi:MAG: tRNA pseudouridine(55) synthase TruB [Eubacteriales bacterium]|nr:tRNA pseudouridine(55) synthase TruB [Eubacteriales bacterium]MDD4474560.1 tRNA pseudouridine(55) synthase TruB [Eubacteriales bacterium]
MKKHGLLIIDKPSGITSHTVVAKVKKLTGASKAGHTGTLDPAASGVMTVMLNSAVKASSMLMEHDKSYVAKIVLGIETDTLDTTGKTIKEYSGELPGIDEVRAVLDSFKGVIKQVPPMYSALKVGGKKLYELARKGEEIEREPRKVRIDYLAADEHEDGIYLTIFCSKGTYIRTLCADIGAKLGCGAAMSSLMRTSVGGFTLDSAISLDDLETMSEEEIENIVIPTESLFSSIKRFELDGFYERLAKNGAEIYLKKLGLDTEFTEGEWLRLYGSDGFFAIGRVQKFPGGLAVKPETMFL